MCPTLPCHPCWATATSFSWWSGWEAAVKKGYAEAARYSLHHHLRNHIERGEAGAGEALFVLAHLDGIQPLVHRVKAGVVGNCAVQQGQVDAGGGAGDRDGQDTCL